MVEINAFWSLITVLGFVGWIASAFLFLFLALDEEDKLHRDQAALWGGLLVVSFAVWVVGLFNA